MLSLKRSALHLLYGSPRFLSSRPQHSSTYEDWLLPDIKLHLSNGNHPFVLLRLGINKLPLQIGTGIAAPQFQVGAICSIAAAIQIKSGSNIFYPVITSVGFQYPPLVVAGTVAPLPANGAVCGKAHTVKIQTCSDILDFIVASVKFHYPFLVVAGAGAPLACVGAVGRTAYAVNIQPCRHVFHFRSVHDTHDRINNSLLRYGIGRPVKQSKTILAVAPIIPNNQVRNCIFWQSWLLLSQMPHGTYYSLNQRPFYRWNHIHR